jgi:Arc/MetJ-type ribon-helix-helix transcriptional regulator
MHFLPRPDLEKFVTDQVKRGGYADASGVLNHALEVLREQLRDAQDLRQEAAVGLGQADRGDFVEFTAEDVKSEGRRILASRHARPAKRRTPNRA